MLRPAPANGLDLAVGLGRAEAGLDGQWPYVGNKPNQHGLWYAVGHASHTVLAYTLGKRQDVVFREPKPLLGPLGIPHYYTDGRGTYGHHLDAGNHQMGKKYLGN